MKLIDFRKNSKLVRQAIKLKDNPVYQEVIKVLWSEHPINAPISRNIGVDEKDTSYQLGTIDGATRVLQVLQTISLPLIEGTELKPTYEPPEQE